MIKFSQAPKSLCIFRLSAIGDVTHILPIIHTLQKVWPQTRITWVIGKLEYQLVKALPDVEFIQFDKSAGWRAYNILRRQLKGRQFDVLLMMQAALRASIASLFISAQYKLGFDKQRAVDFQWLFSNCKISGQTRVHVLDGFFQFLQSLGIEEREMEWDLPIASKDLDYATNISNKQAYIIINPCSSARKNNWRNWSESRYAEIVDYLNSKNFQVILTGGPSS
jgi:heptosyltransferase I